MKPNKVMTNFFLDANVFCQSLIYATKTLKQSKAG